MFRTAWITGATGGLGSALAKELDGAGYSLHLSGRRKGEGERLAASLRDAVFTAGRVEDPSAANEAADLIRKRWNRLDILVNCAGVSHPARIPSLTEVDWDDTIAVNLTGPFLTIRAAAGLLRASRGAIVNIVSLTGLSGAVGAAAYSASKAGLAGLTVSLARELAPEVRVNAIAPGFLDTAMTRDLPVNLRESARSENPLGIITDPSLAAAMILRVAESPHITGQVLVLEGRMVP